MAAIYVAAAPGETAQARAFAEALRALGFAVEAGALAETDIAARVDASLGVLVLWSRAAASAPALAGLAMLALDRKKLIGAELEKNATPAPFRTAPHPHLGPHERTQFRQRFQALIVELDKLSPTKANAAALPQAIQKARTALLAPAAQRQSLWRSAGLIAAGTAALFALGFGAGRVIQGLRSGELHLASLPLTATPTAAAASAPQAAAPQPPLLGLAELKRLPWRDAAARIDAPMAMRIRAEAESGDALAQALACIGHLAGAPGFLPSPTAARTQCDSGAAQDHPAALYYSWVLQRTAAHAGISATEARQRLQRAAQLGWTPAQIDYAGVLANDTGAPLSAHAEAGALLLAAAESGDPRGQFQYARWLRDSPAGPRDPNAAAPFLQRAAEHGDVEAAHMLGTFYRDGIGVARDPARAKALYDQAARGHYAPAMFNLADMLRSGSAAERERAISLYRELACMRDEHQIQPRAVQRLNALGQSGAC